MDLKRKFEFRGGLAPTVPSELMHLSNGVINKTPENLEAKAF